MPLQAEFCLSAWVYHSKSAPLPWLAGTLSVPTGCLWCTLPGALTSPSLSQSSRGSGTRWEGQGGELVVRSLSSGPEIDWASNERCASIASHSKAQSLITARGSASPQCPQQRPCSVTPGLGRLRLSPPSASSKSYTMKVSPHLEKRSSGAVMRDL